MDSEKRFILRISSASSIKYFQAAEPTRIKDYLEKQEAELRKNRTTFEKLLPNLEKLAKFVGKREETEIFLGEKGLKTAFDMLLKGAIKGEKELFFYVYDYLHYKKADNFYRKTWLSILKLGIIADGISNEDYRKTKLSKESPTFIRQRYVPFPVPGNIDIFRDRVLITVWREKPIGILIHSQEVADNFKIHPSIIICYTIAIQIQESKVGKGGNGHKVPQPGRYGCRI